MKYVKIKGDQNHHLFRPIGKDGKERAVFWVRFYREGKGRLEESLKTNILSEARIRRDERMAEFLGERPRHKGKAFLVEEKFPEFLETKKWKAEKTRISMDGQWRLHIEPFFGGMILDEVNEAAWLKYVNHKREAEPDRKFFNDRKYLGMFLKWCHGSGFIEKRPRLENMDPPRNAGKVYSDDEVERLLKAANPTLHLQILMAVTMAMRKGEILKLEWIQVDLTKRTIFLPAHKVKTRKARTFGISPRVFGFLAARRDTATSEWVFPSPKDSAKPLGDSGNQTAWENCRAKAKVTGRFHDLRHTFLTRAFKNHSHMAALICFYAGLSLEEANRTYLHYDFEDTRVVGTLVDFDLGDSWGIRD